MLFAFALIIAAGLAQPDLAQAQAAHTPGGVHPGQASYRLVDLGATGPGSSRAAAVNDKGQVVGWSLDEAGRFTPVMWTRGHMKVLGGQPGEATGINERGMAVGTIDTTSGSTHAFAWTRGRMTDLGSLGGDFSTASGVNDLGQVVGASLTADLQTHPFLWWKGHMTDLTKRGLPADATVSDINNRGQVVGRYPVVGGWHAFRWLNGRVTDLGPASSSDSAALAISETGTAVGYAVPPDATEPLGRPTLWNRHGAVDLGTGAKSGEAYGVNNRGQIVGAAHLTGVSTEPFVWDRGVFTGLPVFSAMAMTAPRAVDINDLGMIAGYCDSVGGATHAVLWLRS